MANAFVSNQSLPDFSLWEKLVDKRTLCSFELEFTARCNLNCRHCYINLPAGDRKARSNELAFDQISRIADEAVSLGAIWCLLNGGEPLLREDFFDIFTALKKKGLLVTVFTNGTLISDRHVQFFKHYPPRDIEMTVYGVTQTTYERITRRPGSYRAFRHGLDLLLSSGIQVTLKAMAMQSNYHEMADISRFCLQYGSRDYRFDPFLHLRYDNDANRNREIIAERLSPEQIITLEESEPSRLEGLRHARIFPGDPGSAKPDVYRIFGCGIGKENCCVSSSGMFSFCSSLRHPDCVYDLKNGSLKEAWEILFPKIRNMRSSRKVYIDNCAECPIINLCRWCPALAHLETGSLDLPVEYFCQTAHDRAKTLKVDQELYKIKIS